MQRYREYQPTCLDRKGLTLPDKQHWFVAPVDQNRDSNCLSRSNFRSFLKALGGESDHVEVCRFGHWGCGWLEIIIIDPESEAVKTAEEIESALADYPVVDEHDYSELSYEEYNESWKDYGFEDFISELKEKFDFSEDIECWMIDEIDKEEMQVFFEEQNPSGDFYNDFEGSVNLSASVDNCTYDDLMDFIVRMETKREHKALTKRNAVPSHKRRR